MSFSAREPINFRRSKRTTSFFLVLVREFLHQFMTILTIKIGQWLRPLHVVFATGLLSHGTIVYSSTHIHGPIMPNCIANLLYDCFDLR